MSPSEWSKENKKGHWHETGFIGRAASLDPAPIKDKKIVLPQELRLKAFQMPQPTAGHPSIESVTLADGDTAILLVHKIKDIDVNESMSSRYRQQLQSAMGQADYDDFIQELRAGADINIHLENVQE